MSRDDVLISLLSTKYYVPYLPKNKDIKKFTVHAWKVLTLNAESCRLPIVFKNVKTGHKRHAAYDHLGLYLWPEQAFIDFAKQHNYDVVKVTKEGITFNYQK